MRYYQKIFSETTNTGQVIMMGLNSGLGHIQWWPSVSMRTRPTVGVTDTTPYWESYPWNTVGTTMSISNVSNGHLTRDGGEIGVYATYSPTLVRGTNYTVDAEVFYFDAEL